MKAEEKQKAKDFLLKEYPQYPGFINHTLVGEMAAKYALSLLQEQKEEKELLKIVKTSYDHFGNDSSKRKICRLRPEDAERIEKYLNSH